MAITPMHANAVGDLTAVHRDPFDRMLIAQAIIEDLTIITHDAIFAEYPINVFKRYTLAVSIWHCHKQIRPSSFRCWFCARATTTAAVLPRSYSTDWPAVDIHWRAWSRGIAVDLGTANVGPISLHAIRGLRRRGLPSEGPFHQPRRNPFQVHLHLLQEQSKKHNATPVVLPPEQRQPQTATLPPSGPTSPMDWPAERFGEALQRRELNRQALLSWIKSNLKGGIDYGQIHVVGKDKCRMAAVGKANECLDMTHWSKPSLWMTGSDLKSSGSEDD